MIVPQEAQNADVLGGASPANLEAGILRSLLRDVSHVASCPLQDSYERRCENNSTATPC